MPFYISVTSLITPVYCITPTEEPIVLSDKLGAAFLLKKISPHPTPHTPHPTPYTPHPTPHTPHPLSSQM
ncbi:MAG: hypothetical protein PX640_04115 [Microcystis sp. M49629_WE12]|nr:hypothetical protein [Microcystis sp. M49629_WE12]